MCHKLSQVSKGHTHCLALNFLGANNFISNLSSLLSLGSSLKTARSHPFAQASLPFSKLSTHHQPGVDWPSLSIKSQKREKLEKLN